jgi:hypothetical protein
LGFTAAGLEAAVELSSGFLCLAVFLVAVILGCLRASVNGWRFWIWGWSAGGSDDTLPSDDVLPAFTYAHLLGRGSGPLSFRRGGVDFGDALSGKLGRLL